jgi:hypothetical protein
MPVVQEPVVTPKPVVDAEVLASIDPALFEDGYIYVHCYYPQAQADTLIRIWRTTYLLDQHSPAKAELIHAENISYAPVWTWIRDSKPFEFLLIFSSLPKSCRVFDLIEQIPQPGGFEVRSIQRNETDVYHVRI